MKSKILRFISFILVFIVLIGVYVPVAQATDTPFTDVPQDAWFAETVAWAFENGITRGFVGTNEFRPDISVTRGQFVTFMYRVAGEPSVSFIPRFNDVTNATRYYFQAVQWAAIRGITTGYSDANEFRPYNPITREEIATMLYRFAQHRNDDLTIVSGVLYRFPDRRDISGFAVESMSWAATHGIVRGNRGRLLPEESATRAEALTMLYRHVEDVPFTLPPIAGFGHGSVVNGVTIGNAATRTDNDLHVWNFFRGKGLSPQATAGIMGNLFAESGMRSDIVERAHLERIIRDNDWPAETTYPELIIRYTEAVNTGTYRTAPSRIPTGTPIDSRNSFIFDRVGYGLSQWTFPARKRELYDFIMARDGTFSIGNLDAQLDFFWLELTTSHVAVFRQLDAATCILEASNIILRRFMNPANQDEGVQGRRAGYSLGYFLRFAE